MLETLGCRVRSRREAQEKVLADFTEQWALAHFPKEQVRRISHSLLVGALEDAKAELSYNRADFSEISALKTERDARRRDLGAGTIWGEAQATLH